MNRTSIVTGLLCIVAGLSVVLLVGTWLLGGGQSSQSGAGGTAIPANMGVVSVPNDGNTYELWLAPGGGRRYFTYMAKPTAVVPPNNYVLRQYFVRDSQNPSRCISVRPMIPLTVTAGATTALSIGSPFTAQITNNSSNPDVVSLSFALTDCGGRQCKAQGASMPGFQILSSSGQVLQQGTFQYG